MLRIEKVRKVLLCFALLVILVIVVISFKDDRKIEIIPESHKKEAALDAPDVKLENVIYTTVNEDNIKEWELNADSARYFEDRELLFLEEVEVTLYSDDKIYHLTGNEGRFNTKTRDIEVKGQVKVVMPDSTELHTETLNYDHQKKLMTSKNKVLIRREKVTINGVGVVINLNENKLLILDKVRASQNAKKK
jgi:LPS export ABC transporter protein LptC